MLADSTRPRPVMLDVRNQYEYDVGHFDGAVRPQGVVCHTGLEPQALREQRARGTPATQACGPCLGQAQFSESDAASFGLDPNNATAKEETEVMMCRTGLGLRLGLRARAGA